MAADFDGDGMVGFYDLVLFAEFFGLTTESVGWDSRYDLDGSGAVDMTDFLLFVDFFWKKL